MKKQYHSQKSKQTNKKVMFRFDLKDKSILNIKTTTPKGNKVNLDFTNDLNAPDINMRIKE